MSSILQAFPELLGTKLATELESRDCKRQRDLRDEARAELESVAKERADVLEPIAARKWAAADALRQARLALAQQERDYGKLCSEVTGLQHRLDSREAVANRVIAENSSR